jgi:lipid-binding SYLF domain-containing protein
MHVTRRGVLVGAPVGLAVFALPADAEAVSARTLTTESKQALAALYGTNPKTRELSRKAKGVLVFPKIVKAGLMIGGQTGDGALLMDGRAEAFYNLSAASFGLQVGAQRFSYALFFMNNEALTYLDKSDGWSIGSGPSLVVADKGLARSLTSTTLTHDVYAFPFGQKGIMAGIGLEGSKVTRITPDR